MHLALPEHINSDALIPFLNLLSLHRDEPTITLDFSQLNRISPAGFSSLTAWQTYRRNHGYITNAEGISKCPISGYLQRLNLLSLCNWDILPSQLPRNDPSRRFIPLEKIAHPIESLGERFFRVG